MAEVTQEMILDYLVKKGGVVRNVDLVRHFKKYLQMESAQEKGKPRSLLLLKAGSLSVYGLKDCG